MELYTMSKRELGRLDLIQRIEAKDIGVTAAARLMGLSRSQVHRLLAGYRERGAAALISTRRGKRSNRALPDVHRELAIAIIAERYADFGPTLAAEKLSELHDLTVSKETIRKWMIAAGFWTTKADRRRIYQPRNRRDCLGELVQIDGSPHAWFEDRGPKCALLVFIDDATSAIMHLRFCPSESTFDYMAAFRAYVGEHGKPVAFYSDKHSIFRTPKAARKTSGDQEGMTQFGRMLDELNIDIICANTPQAKGRVERANRTLQDRLVKELRLQGIDTIEDANGFAPAFMEDFNRRFAKPAKNPKDVHRPLAPHDDLNGSACVKHQRTVSNSLTVIYDRVLFILERNQVSERLCRKRVMVCDYPDGRLEIRHGNDVLPYTTFDKQQRVKRAEVVENKRLDDVLAIIATQQQKTPPKRSTRTPRRRGQGPNIFELEGGQITP